MYYYWCYYVYIINTLYVKSLLITVIVGKFTQSLSSDI